MFLNSDFGMNYQNLVVFAVKYQVFFFRNYTNNSKKLSPDLFNLAL